MIQNLRRLIMGSSAIGNREEHDVNMRVQSAKLDGCEFRANVHVQSTSAIVRYVEQSDIISRLLHYQGSSNNL